MEEIALLKKCDFLGKTLSVYGTTVEPLFLAKEVAEWLEHSDTHKLVANVDDDEKVRNIVPTLGGKQNCWFLTEQGLYEVLMQSRKPIAKQFKQGVKQILKEIRLTGSYNAAPTAEENILDNPDKMIEALIAAYNAKKERVKELESELATVQQKALPPSHTPKKQGISRKLHIVKQCTIVDTDLMLFADGNNQPWFLLNRLTSWFCRENTKVIKGAYLTRYISDKNKRQFNNPTPFSGGMKSWFVNPDGLNELFLHYDKQGGLDLQPYQDGIKQILSEY